MYQLIKIILIIICLFGLIYMFKAKKSYQQDSTTKDEIIKYFKEHNATNVENGIKTKDLPPFIAKSPTRLLMVKDKTLIFTKGKYYLNKSK